MKAWQFTGTGQPLEWVELPDPEPAAGQVLLDVEGSGLCHTDVGVLHDHGWANLHAKLPIVIGHEVAGTIRAMAPDVTGWNVGDRVGVCPTTVAGAPGFSFDGGFAEQMVVDARALVPIPENVDFLQGAAATDAGMTSHHAVMVTGGLKPGMKVGLIGLGGLGQIGARVAALNGAEVFVAETDESVWGLADDLGVRGIARTIGEFAHEGLELIVDYAGFGTTTADAIEAVARKGRVVQVGMGKLSAEISTRELILKEVTLVGSSGGTPEDIRGVYELISSGQLNPTLHAISLEEIPDGLERLHRGDVTGRLVACPNA